MTVQELCELVVVNGIDMTILAPEDIQEMVVKGGADLRKFYGMLSSFSANIPPDLDEKEREKNSRRSRRRPSKHGEHVPASFRGWKTRLKRQPQTKVLRRPSTW